MRRLRVDRYTHGRLFRRESGLAFERGMHHQNRNAFYPSRFATQRWFKGDGRERRDPETRGLRYGGQVYF